LWRATQVAGRALAECSLDGVGGDIRVFEVAAAGTAWVVYLVRPRGDGFVRLRCPRGDGVTVRDLGHDVYLDLVHVRVARRGHLAAQVGRRHLDQGFRQVCRSACSTTAPSAGGNWALARFAGRWPSAARRSRGARRPRRGHTRTKCQDGGHASMIACSCTPARGCNYTPSSALAVTGRQDPRPALTPQSRTAGLHPAVSRKASQSRQLRGN
jgi:hypothetical protein